MRAFSFFGDGLETEDIILSLLGAKPDLFQIHLALQKLVKMETLLLANQVLSDGCLALSIGDDLVVCHLDREFELAFSMRILVAHIVVVEDKRLAPGYLCNLICVFL